MRDALRLHTVTHLRFFLRSRLLLGLAVVLALVWSLGFVGFMIAGSSGDRFDMLRLVSDELRGFAWFYTAAMGLFALWWHTSQRTTAVLFTRAARPELWLGSVFVSAMGVAAIVHVAGLLVTLGLSLAWGIPFQGGFVWLALDGIAESVILISVLTGLGAAVHPILAVLVVAVFSEGMFYWMDTLLLGYMKADGGSGTIRVFEGLVRGFHALLPMLDPFSERTRDVEATLRASGHEWLWLAATAGYAVVVAGFWFLFADYRIKRRALS